MNQLIKQVSPYVIAIVGLFFAGFVSSLVAQPKSNQPVNKKVEIVTTAAPITSHIPSMSAEKKRVTKAVYEVIPTKSIPTITASPTIVKNFDTSIAVMSTPMPSPSMQTYKINVSIVNSSSFVVAVPESASHCDVLTYALNDGKLSSLNMRYDSTMETYAVYQINGIGKENSVWWTYKVNGQSPNQGCSYIKANDNDSVIWEYIGS